MFNHRSFAKLIQDHRVGDDRTGFKTARPPPPGTSAGSSTSLDVSIDSNVDRANLQSAGRKKSSKRQRRVSASFRCRETTLLINHVDRIDTASKLQHQRARKQSKAVEERAESGFRAILHQTSPSRLRTERKELKLRNTSPHPLGKLFATPPKS